MFKVSDEDRKQVEVKFAGTARKSGFQSADVRFRLLQAEIADFILQPIDFSPLNSSLLCVLCVTSACSAVKSLFPRSSTAEAAENSRESA